MSNLLYIFVNEKKTMKIMKNTGSGEKANKGKEKKYEISIME